MFTRKFLRRLILSAVIVSSTFLVITSNVWDLRTSPPPGTAEYCSSFVLGYLGLWDTALGRARTAARLFEESNTAAEDGGIEASKSAAAEDGDRRRRTLAAAHRRVAFLLGRTGQYAEAVRVMEGEVLPRIRGAGGSEYGMVQQQTHEMILSDLSDLYRRRGMYRRGLEVLAEAQGLAEVASERSQSRDGENDGGSSKGRSFFGEVTDGLTRSALERERELLGEEMRDLAAMSEEQDHYLSLTIETAAFYDFTARRRRKIPPSPPRDDDIGEDDSAEVGDAALALRGAVRERCRFYSSHRSVLLYAPSDALFVTLIVLVLFGPLRSAFKGLSASPPAATPAGAATSAPTKPSKMSRLGRYLRLLFILLDLLFLLLWWSHARGSDAGRYNDLGRLASRVNKALIFVYSATTGGGSSKTMTMASAATSAALFTYDAARCSLLSHPREEEILTTDTAMETFAGAAFVLEWAGDDAGGREERDLTDQLLRDVDALLNSRGGAGRPSFWVAGHFLRVSELYRVRASHGTGAGAEAQKSVSAEARKRARRYKALAESETQRLARFIEEMVEAEVERSSKQMRKSGKKGGADGGRNITLGSNAVDDGDMEEEDQRITVKMDR